MLKNIYKETSSC